MFKTKPTAFTWILVKTRVFAQEGAKVNDSLMQVRFNHRHCFLFLFGVLLIRKTDFGVHLRHRGVGKVRIISTPDRNRNVCH